jgi:hypothetical protein
MMLMKYNLTKVCLAAQNAPLFTTNQKSPSQFRVKNHLYLSTENNDKIFLKIEILTFEVRIAAMWVKPIRIHTRQKSIHKKAMPSYKAGHRQLLEL